jgi:hypothetical protein
VVNGETYDMIKLLWVTYDGKALFLEGDREILEDKIRRLGTPSNGVPTSCAIGNPNDPQTIIFDCPCSEAKTVEFYYSRITTAFTDLPKIWHRSALPYAKARAMETAIARVENKNLMPVLVELKNDFNGQFESWVNGLARKLKFRDSKLDRMTLRNGWLTD